MKKFICILFLISSSPGIAQKIITAAQSELERALAQRNIYKNLSKRTVDKLSNWATHIIVGAGASGSVLAARLAENQDNKVLVIDLGPYNISNSWITTPAKSLYLYNHPDGPRPSPSSLAFKTKKQIDRVYNYPRGNGLGGSTNHHTLIDGRGSAEIYNKIADLVGDERWSYNNILPYYKKMENYGPKTHSDSYHGKSGWLQIKKGTIKSPFHKDFIASAQDVTKAPFQEDMSGNPEHAAGIGITELQVSPNGKRSAAYQDLLLKKLATQNNIKVILNTVVSRVLFDQNSDPLRAIGVECLYQPRAYLADNSKNKDETGTKLKANFYAQKEVILSAGAINTPQLLMLSGIGPRKHLTSLNIPVLLDKPGVGSDLLDHNEVNVIHEIDSHKLVWPAQAANIIEKIDSILKQDSITEYQKEKLQLLKKRLKKFADKQEQSELAGGVMLDWHSGLPSDIGHDLHMHSDEGFFYDFDLSSSKPLPDGKLRVDYLRAESNPLHQDFLRVFHHVLIEVLKITASPGTIRLSSADPTVPPIIDLALHKDTQAHKRLARGIKIIRKIMQSPGLKKYLKLDSSGNPIELFPGSQYKTEKQLTDYLKKWSSFGHHISGTAKMGKPDNPVAVVDSQLRVLGAPNLRVVDTSIYPTPYLHGYNTSRGAYLIGEVAADLIKQAN